MVKMVIVLPEHLKMSPGKAMSQAVHVAVELGARAGIAEPSKFNAMFPVLVCRAKSDVTILKLAHRAADLGIPYYIFTDCNPTTEGTAGKITGFGVGPAAPELVDKVTGKLELY
jgi:peptidyl-tRNA hydrolase